MKIKRKVNQREVVVLGISVDKYLVYPDVSGMVSWYDKDYYEALENEPEYFVKDDDIQNQKVVELFKRKYDLDFLIKKLEWNETLSPQYFKYKRIKLALESIGMGNLFHSKDCVYSDDFYFSMMVGKFETLNEVIDSQLQDKEAHSRFEWHRITNHNKFEKELTNEAIEKGVIELCQFVSSKVIGGKYNGFLFTDIYALWKTFLLGDEFKKYGEINMIDQLEPKFVCIFKKEEVSYHFKYQFFNW